MAQTNNTDKKNALQGLFQLAGRIIRLEPGDVDFKDELPRDAEFLGYESFCALIMTNSAAPLKQPEKKA